MYYGEILSAGHTVRLTNSYLEAKRGYYTVVYVYTNGWLGLVSHRDGRNYDIPAHICRLIEASTNGRQ